MEGDNPPRAAEYDSSGSWAFVFTLVLALYPISFAHTWFSVALAAAFALCLAAPFTRRAQVVSSVAIAVIFAAAFAGAVFELVRAGACAVDATPTSVFGCGTNETDLWKSHVAAYSIIALLSTHAQPGAIPRQIVSISWYHWCTPALAAMTVAMDSTLYCLPALFHIAAYAIAVVRCPATELRVHPVITAASGLSALATGFLAVVARANGLALEANIMGIFIFAAGCAIVSATEDSTPFGPFEAKVSTLVRIGSLFMAFVTLSLSSGWPGVAWAGCTVGVMISPWSGRATVCVALASLVTVSHNAIERGLGHEATGLALPLLSAMVCIVLRTEASTGIPIELTSSISTVFIAAGFRVIGLGSLVASSVFAANILHFPLFALAASIAMKPSGKVQWALAEGYTACLAVAQYALSAFETSETQADVWGLFSNAAWQWYFLATLLLCLSNFIARRSTKYPSVARPWAGAWCCLSLVLVYAVAASREATVFGWIFFLAFITLTPVLFATDLQGPPRIVRRLWFAVTMIALLTCSALYALHVFPQVKRSIPNSKIISHTPDELISSLHLLIVVVASLALVTQQTLWSIGDRSPNTDEPTGLTLIKNVWAECVVLVGVASLVVASCFRVSYAYARPTTPIQVFFFGWTAIVCIIPMVRQSRVTWRLLQLIAAGLGLLQYAIQIIFVEEQQSAWFKMGFEAIQTRTPIFGLLLPYMLLFVASTACAQRERWTSCDSLISLEDAARVLGYHLMVLGFGAATVTNKRSLFGVVMGIITCAIVRSGRQGIRRGPRLLGVVSLAFVICALQHAVSLWLTWTPSMSVHWYIRSGLGTWPACCATVSFCFAASYWSSLCTRGSHPIWGVHPDKSTTSRLLDKFADDIASARRRHTYAIIERLVPVPVNRADFTTDPSLAARLKMRFYWYGAAASSCVAILFGIWDIQRGLGIAKIFLLVINLAALQHLEGILWAGLRKWRWVLRSTTIVFAARMLFSSPVCLPFGDFFGMRRSAAGSCWASSYADDALLAAVICCQWIYSSGFERDEYAFFIRYLARLEESRKESAAAHKASELQRLADAHADVQLRFETRAKELRAEVGHFAASDTPTGNPYSRPPLTQAAPAPPSSKNARETLDDVVLSSFVLHAACCPCLCNILMPLCGVLSRLFAPRPGHAYWSICSWYLSIAMAIKGVFRQSECGVVITFTELFFGRLCSPSYFVADMLLQLLCCMLVIGVLLWHSQAGHWDTSFLWEIAESSKVAHPAPSPRFYVLLLRNIWATDLKSGVDLYARIFAVDILSTIVLFFCYSTLAETGNSVVDSLQSSSLLPGGLALTLLVLFIIMVLDRCAHIRRNIAAKLVLVVSLTVVYNAAFLWWYFGVSALYSESELSLWKSGAGPVAAFLYCLKSACLVFGADQLRRGFTTHASPLVVSGNRSTKEYVAYITYRLIPFAYDLSILLDWAVTSTSLTCQEWCTLGDVSHEIYVNDVERRAAAERSLTEPTPKRDKFLQGWLIFLLLAAVLFAPVVAYSSWSPVLDTARVSKAYISLHLPGVPPLWEVSISPSGTLMSPDEKHAIETLRPSVRTTRFLRGDVQIIDSQAFSASRWNPSSPALKNLLQLLAQRAERLEMTIRLNLVTTTASGFSHQNAMDQTRALTDMERRQVAALIQGGDDVVLPHLFNPWIYDHVGGLVTPNIHPASWKHCRLRMVAAGEYFELKCSGVFEQSNPNGTSPRLSGVEKQCDHSAHCALVEFLPPAQTKEWRSPQIYVQPSSSLSVGLLNSFGIVAAYTTFVLAVGRIVRFLFTGGAYRVTLECLKDSSALVNVIEFMEMARVRRLYEEERQAFDLLVDTLRVTEILERRTRKEKRD